MECTCNPETVAEIIKNGKEWTETRSAENKNETIN
jgi:hypothetical protein